MSYDVMPPLADNLAQSGSEQPGPGFPTPASRRWLRLCARISPVQCMKPREFGARGLAPSSSISRAPAFMPSKPIPILMSCGTFTPPGIRHFDVASLNEVKLVRGLFPDAHLAFMHPIKSREAIRAAYFDYGVRDFVIDTFEEMHKILEETKVAADLLHHRQARYARRAARLAPWPASSVRRLTTAVLSADASTRWLINRAFLPCRLTDARSGLLCRRHSEKRGDDCPTRGRKSVARCVRYRRRLPDPRPRHGGATPDRLLRRH